METILYYESQAPGLGERFAAEVRHATEQLLKHPKIGAADEEGFRKWLLDTFPYNLRTLSFFDDPGHERIVDPQVSKKKHARYAGMTAPGPVRQKGHLQRLKPLDSRFRRNDTWLPVFVGTTRIGVAPSAPARVREPWADLRKAYEIGRPHVWSDLLTLS